MDRHIKELFYLNDTRQHQQYVAGYMIECAKKLLDRATCHDASKLAEPEIESYIDPVWVLNNEDIEYGSERYKEVTARMGEGWEHHKAVNDHHVEHWSLSGHPELPINDPIRYMDMFALLEMLCDWVAASKRKGNDPALPIDHIKKKIGYGLDPQLESILRNTLDKIK